VYFNWKGLNKPYAIQIVNTAWINHKHLNFKDQTLGFRNFKRYNESTTGILLGHPRLQVVKWLRIHLRRFFFTKNYQSIQNSLAVTHWDEHPSRHVDELPEHPKPWEHTVNNWFVVWNMNFIFPIILGISSSQLTNSIIFQRGGEKPPTR
jgi:hypothetical protein